MRLNQKGFSAVEILIVIIVIALVGFVGWRVYDSNKDGVADQTNSNNVMSEPNKTILGGIEGSLVLEANTEYCENPNDKETCRTYTTSVIDTPVSTENLYLSLVDNINKNGWTYENTDVKSPILSDPKGYVDSINLNALSEDTPDNRAYVALSFITGGLFGEHSLLQKDSKLLRIDAAPASSIGSSSQNDIEYSFRSVFGVNEAEANKMFEYLSQNPEAFLIGVSTTN